MARVVDGQDESITEEVVYDSQEEQDQWPDSQPQNPAEENPGDVQKPQRWPKVYGKQQNVLCLLQALLILVTSR